MEPKDMEELLKNVKFMHLSEATLVSYRDSQLEEIGMALANTHLSLCLVCERRLTFLMEEARALESYEITENHRAVIKETIRKLEPEATDCIQTEIQRLGITSNELESRMKLLSGQDQNERHNPAVQA